MGDVYSGGAIYLSGSVGDWPGEECFTPSDVRTALARHGRRPLTVHINSGGGFASNGVEIYHQLRDHPAEVTVFVSGIAASAASLIAMAGKQIVMRRGSTMMIHDPSGVAIGPAREMEVMRQQLEAIATEYANIYAARSGKTVAEARAIMVAETWFTGAEAVQAGFANRLDHSEAMAFANFDYGRIYAHAPKQVFEKSRRASSLNVLHEAVDFGNAVAKRTAPPKPASSNSVLAGVMADFNRRQRPR